MPNGLDLSDVPADLVPAVEAALLAAGVSEGHIAVEIVTEERIQELNRDHRDRDKPTDVLAFPIDETGPVAGPRELGDVVICPEHCSDVTEAAVHGTLHLCGYDHEVDEGEMLALQAEVLKNRAAWSSGQLTGTSSASRPGVPGGDANLLKHQLTGTSSASRPGVPGGDANLLKHQDAGGSGRSASQEAGDSGRSASQSRCFTPSALPPDGSGSEAEQPAVDETPASPLPSERQTRSGFVALAGRPNVGKSTLVNAIVGSHVAIVSMRPQTTRRAARGVATDREKGWQLVLVDLPGVQRPRDVLTERMQRRVERELADSDVALLVINGEEGVGAGDRFIAQTLLAANAGVPVICVVNKMDQMSRAETLKVLSAAAELEVVDEVFPISALSGEGVEALVERLAQLMPEGHYMYPPEDRTDQSRELQLAELIREQVLLRTRDEIPHSVEVKVLEVETREDGLLTIRAEIWPETESQKGILIGKGGRKIQEVGSGARRRIETEFAQKVHLDLRIRTRPHWRRDESLLDRLGIE